MKWNELSMADRARYIRMGVASGLTNLNDIHSVYDSYIGTNTSSTEVNSYKDGGFLSTIKSFFGIEEDKPEKVSPSRFNRVRQNDSPTSKESMILEDDVAKRQKALLNLAAKNHAPSSEEYYIPYTGEELVIPGVGRVSANTLDSIAVNAERANIPLRDALGLSSVETKMGASPNMSTQGFIDSFKKTNGRKPTSKEIRKFERNALNSSYMRNYGGIYPQYLVNNHEWSTRGWEKSPKYKEKLEGIESPLQHAFTQFKLGIYNSGDKSHTKKVRNEGDRLLSLPVIKEWRRKYNQKKKK